MPKAPKSIPGAPTARREFEVDDHLSQRVRQVAALAGVINVASLNASLDPAQLQTSLNLLESLAEEVRDLTLKLIERPRGGSDKPPKVKRARKTRKPAQGVKAHAGNGHAHTIGGAQ